MRPSSDAQAGLLSSLSCFVAMALGRQDTDELYDLSIEPTAHGLGLKIGRIDRLNHNDDINLRILKEIDACDLVLADLTYARPSVYFEAGYAQRIIPVVYTCRSDHMEQQAAVRDDLRVHFDLQMKNLVLWRTPDDAAFRRKLASRLRVVSGPLVQAKSGAAGIEAQRSEFYSLPVRTQLDNMLDACIRELKKVGFRELESDSTGSTIHELKPFEWVGYRVHNETREFALVAPVSQLGEKEATDTFFALNHLFLFASGPDDGYTNLPSARIAYACVLRKVDDMSIRSILAGCSLRRKDGVITLADRPDGFFRMTLHVLDEIQSEHDLLRRLAAVL